MDKLLINTAYFPPVQYFSKLKKYEDIYIEQYENYGKQSYRSRCEIMSANGVIPLVIPVMKATRQKVLTKDVQIDYAIKWQKLHFRGIESAYKNSPFYDYYIDDLMIYFEKKEKYLLDFNIRTLESVTEFLKLKRKLHFTEDYHAAPTGYCDLRDFIHPKASRKQEDPEFIARPYRQTFSDRFPFTPNLSILDLLFNTGPDTIQYL